MKRSLVFFSFVMFSLFATATSARASSIVLMSQTGNTYNYGLSVDANTSVPFNYNQTIDLTGLTGVTSSATSSWVSFFTDTFTPTSVTLTATGVTFENGENYPWVFDLFSLTSSSTTLGTVAYSIHSESGTFSGFTQGPVAADSPVPEPSSIVLLGTGLLAAAGAVRRKLTV